MEKNAKIKTNDNHIIYGVLNYQQKSDKLIIFVHGLTGHKNEHQFYNAARFFPTHGFATFRFDLYSDEKKGRILSYCTIETHSHDLNAVIDHFNNDYKKIYLVGHSLGGPTILLTDTNSVESIVLWDPSFDILKGLREDTRFDKRINKYIVKFETEFLLCPEMIESWKKLGDNLLEHFSKPTKIICAGKGILYKDWKKNLPKIKVQTDFVIIKNAGHCFNEEGVEEVLFNETLECFKR